MSKQSAATAIIETLVRDSLLPVSARLAPLLAAETDTARARALLQTELEAALIRASDALGRRADRETGELRDQLKAWADGLRPDPKKTD